MNWTYRTLTGETITLANITITQDDSDHRYCPAVPKIYFKDENRQDRIWLRDRGRLTA